MVAGHISGNAGTSFGAVAAGEMLRLGNLFRGFDKKSMEKKIMNLLSQMTPMMAGNREIRWKMGFLKSQQSWKKLGGF
jgi:hypothetical protein